MDFPLVELLGVADEIEHFHIRGGEFRREQPVIGEDEVMRGNGYAVRPFRAAAQVERPDGAIGIAFP